MRQIVTGVDADGRSCVVKEYRLDPKSGDRSRMLVSFTTEGEPAPPRPAGQGDQLDLGLAAGSAQVMVAQWAAGFTHRMHHTDTIDVDTVLEGSAVLVLDDGRHVLEVGDVAIVTGVDHAWEAGPEGTTITFVNVGTPSPE
jgi:hypothetical protein